MGPWGALIMGFFGSVFFVWASTLAARWRGPLAVLAVLAVALIAAAAWRLIRRAPPNAFEPDARAGRIIGRATIFEAIGIPLVALTLANTGHGDIVVPAIAIVVGLHFLRMAFAIPFRAFYALAAALLTAAAVGIALPQPGGSIETGFVAALALWLAALLALRRGQALLARAGSQALP